MPFGANLHRVAYKSDQDAPIPFVDILLMVAILLAVEQRESYERDKQETEREQVGQLEPAYSSGHKPAICSLQATLLNE